MSSESSQTSEYVPDRLGSKPQQVRLSRRRRQRIEDYIHGLLPADISHRVEVQVHPEVPTAFVVPADPDKITGGDIDLPEVERRQIQSLVNGVDGDYLVVVTGREVDGTPIGLDDQLTVDRSFQFGAALHETLHILKTASGEVARLLREEVDDEYQDLVHSLYNTVEDGAIEHEVKTGDNFTDAAAARLTVARILTSPRTDETWGTESDPREYTLIEAIKTVLYDRLIYDTGQAAILTDQDDGRATFHSKQAERAFEIIEPAVDTLVDDVRSLRSDTDKLHSHDKAASIARMKRVLEFWDNILKPLIDQGQPPTQSNRNTDNDDTPSASGSPNHGPQGDPDTGQSAEPPEVSQPDGSPDSSQANNDSNGQGEAQQRDPETGSTGAQDDEDNRHGCPECGDELETPHGRRVHYGRKHGDTDELDEQLEEEAASQQSREPAQGDSEGESQPGDKSNFDPDDFETDLGTEDTFQSAVERPEVGNEPDPDDISAEASIVKVPNSPNDTDSGRQGDDSAESNQPKEDEQANPAQNSEANGGALDDSGNGQAANQPEASGREGEQRDSMGQGQSSDDGSTSPDGTENSVAEDESTSANGESSSSEPAPKSGGRREDSRQGPESGKDDSGQSSQSGSTTDSQPSQDSGQLELGDFGAESNSGGGNGQENSIPADGGTASEDSDDSASANNGEDNGANSGPGSPESNTTGQQPNETETVESIQDRRDQATSEGGTAGPQTGVGDHPGSGGEQPKRQRDSSSNTQSGSGTDSSPEPTPTADQPSSTGKTGQTPEDTASVDIRREETEGPAHSDSDISDGDLARDREEAQMTASESAVDPSDVADELRGIAEALSDEDAPTLSGEENPSGRDGGPGTLDELKVLPEPKSGQLDQSWTDIEQGASRVAQTLERSLVREQTARHRRGQSSGTLNSTDAYKLSYGDTGAFGRDIPGGNKEYHLVLVLDRSSSMSFGSGEISTATKAVTQLALAAENLGVSVTVIDFIDDQARLVKPTSIDTETARGSLLDQATGGNTPLADAIRLARIAVEDSYEEPLIITVTDGLPNDLDNTIGEIRSATMPVCSITTATTEARDSFGGKAETLSQEFDRAEVVFSEDQLNQSLDRFASLLAGY